MVGSSDRISAVPTNIITGFLGVGKTTAILHLLKTKPAHQRWAVLVNEFGEIGVDGSLMQGQYSEEKGVYIREVPGGCMCCAAGLPMQIMLNQLLIISRPDRLLIEPTGLGHPKEVLQVLQSGLYQDTLNVQQILTLVNARHLADERYTDNDTYNQQISIADTIVGNKSDLYQPEDTKRLQSYVKQKGNVNAKVVFTSHGQLDPSYLENKSDSAESTIHNEVTHHHHDHNDSSGSVQETTLPACGYEKAVNKGEGYNSVGWRFSAEIVFSHSKLWSFLSGIEAERMKAVFITDGGVYGYNLASTALTEITISECEESRIEIIASTVDDEWEDQLMLCMNQ